MKKILIILMILVSSTAFSQVTLTADSSYIKIVKSGQPTLFYFTRDAKLAYDNAYLYFSNKSGSVTWEYTLPYADISSYNGILKAAPGFPNFTTLKANLVACIKYGKASGGGGSGIAAWGYITGTLSSQTDLWAAIRYKQDSTLNPFYFSGGKILARQNLNFAIGSATNPLHHLVIGANSANRYGFNVVFTSTNKYRPTLAEAKDTSTFNFDFTPGGKPLLALKSSDGSNTMDIDSNKVVLYGGQYSASKYTITATAGTPNTATVNWNNGNVQYLVLLNATSTATTFTFSNPKDGGRYILILKQPASGTAATVTWDGKVLWSNAATPVLTTTSNKVDIFSFIYDGTNDKYYGGNSFNY
jgi:hypothetical protein